MENAQIRQAAQVQQLAEEYASYSFTKGGLGNVLGGIAGIAIYVLNGVLGSGIWTAIITLGLTAGWLAGKELIRQRLYRTFGKAQENWPEQQRSKHFKLALFFIVVAAAIWIWLILVYIYVGTIPFINLLLGLVCAASIPWIVWRFLRNTDELMVGVFLLLCCTIASIGSVLHPSGVEGWLGTLVFPLYSLLLLGRGIQEHLSFRRLVSQLHGLEEGE